MTKFKHPNTIVIHPDFADITKLRKSLIPEESNLALIGVLYNGEITLDNQELMPEVLGGGAYTMGFRTQNRARLTCPKIDLTVPEVNLKFDRIMDDLCGLSEKRFGNLKDDIRYKINKLYFVDKLTGRVYCFKTTDVNNERVLILVSINSAKVADADPQLWIEDAIKALADIFYVTCHVRLKTYAPGSSCMSLAMYKKFKEEEE